MPTVKNKKAMTALKHLNAYIPSHTYAFSDKDRHAKYFGYVIKIRGVWGNVWLNNRLDRIKWDYKGDDTDIKLFNDAHNKILNPTIDFYTEEGIEFVKALTKNDPNIEANSDYRVYHNKLMGDPSYVISLYQNPAKIIADAILKEIHSGAPLYDVTNSVYIEEDTKRVQSIKRKLKTDLAAHPVLLADVVKILKSSKSTRDVFKDDISPTVQSPKEDDISPTVQPTKKDDISPTVQSPKKDLLIKSKDDISPTVLPPKKDDISPTVLPPKEDDISPTVQSPKKDDISPTVQSPKKDDISPTVQSPKEDDISPTVQSPKKDLLIKSKDDISPTVLPPKKDDISPTVQSPKKDDISPTVQSPKEDDISPTVQSPKKDLLIKSKDDISPTVLPPKKDDISPTVLPPKEDDISPTVQSPKEDDISPTVQPTKKDDISPTVQSTKEDLLSKFKSLETPKKIILAVGLITVIVLISQNT